MSMTNVSNLPMVSEDGLAVPDTPLKSDTMGHGSPAFLPYTPDNDGIATILHSLISAADKASLADFPASMASR